MNQVVPAEVEHVEYLAARIRQADLDELRAVCDMDPLDALLMSFCLSTRASTWLVDGEVAAVFGVAGDSDRPGVGCPWLIGTEKVKEHRAFFLRHSRGVVDEMLADYPLLENYVHPSNTLSIRWLEWCGFEFDDLEPYGARGDLFVPFFKERPPCATSK